MATASRDAKLTLSVEALGQENIDKLEKALRQLAATGDAGAADFGALADQIGRLGSQNDALQTVKALTADTEGLRDKQEQAATAVQALASKLDTLKAATGEAKTAQDAARAALVAGEQAYVQAGNALRQLQTEYDGAGRQTDEYRNRLQTLTGEQNGARLALVGLREANRQAAAAVADANAEQRKVESAYRGANAEYTRTTAALNGQEKALRAASSAAEEYGVNTADLVSAEATLAAAFTNASAVVRDAEAALADAARKQADLAASTQRVNDAFKQIDARPVEAVRQEIAETRTAMETLAASGKLTGNALAVAMAQGETKVRALELEMRQLTGTTTLADKAAGLLKGSIGKITAGNVIADGVGYLANKVKDMGREFIAAVVQIDQLRRGLGAIYKDAGTTAVQIDFLRRTASEAGVSVGGLSQDFTKFAAAMTGAQVPLSESNALFRAVIAASGTLGLSADETGGALNALSQMASKGTVSMEELRQQLGDRLPGAFGLVAKGLGITEAQLAKLVESGNLAARDLFPALTTALGTLKGETDGLRNTWERFTSALTVAAQNAGDSGWTVVLNGALKLLGGTAAALALAVSTLSEGLFSAGRAAVVFFDALRGNGSEAIAWFTAETEKMNSRLSQQAAALDYMLEPSERNRKAMEQASEAAQRLGTSHEQAGAAMGATAAAAVAAASGLEDAERAATLQALATKLAADNTLDLSAKLVQFNVAATEMLSAQQKQTEAAEKMAKAARVEGEALVTLAKLRGDEQTALVAGATAAENYATKMHAAAQSQATETDILKQQLAALDANAKAREGGAAATKTQREALENKIKVSEAETEQAKASATAARQEAVARRIAAESYADNSDKVEQYRQAMLSAARDVAAMEDLQKKGAATAAQLQDAQDKLTIAVGKYNDSLGDATRLQQAYADASKTVYAQDAAALNLALEQAKSTERMAVLRGDEAAARKAAISQREIELQMVKLKVAAMEAEAQGMINVARAAEAELIAKNALTPVEQVRISNALRLAEIKMLEAKATGESIAAMEKELQALKTSSTYRDNNTRAIHGETTARGHVAAATDRQSEAMDKLLMRYKNSADYTESQIKLLEREAAAAERAAEAYRKKWNIDKDGFTLDKNGQRMQQSAPTERYVYDTAKSQGLSEQEALALTDRFMQNGRPSGMRGGILGASSDWFSQVNAAINEQVMANARAKVSNPTVAPNDTTSTTGSQRPATPSAGSTRTVNVTINGGRSRSINTASAQDSDALVSLLRQLESEGGRAA